MEKLIDAAALTPLQQVGDFLIKREDLFEVVGVHGGKARTCWDMAQGAPGLVTAVSRRFSAQGAIVAHVAKSAQGGEIVCVFSNGGFGGIHGKLLERLGRV